MATYSQDMEPFHVVLLGDSKVGKTALANQWCLRCEPEVPYDNYDQMNDYHFDIIVDWRQYKVVIYDTESEMKFASLIEEHMNKCQAFLLIYGVNLRESFNRIQDLLNDKMFQNGNAKHVFTLVGNKSDKLDERQVSTEEGMELARKHGCGFMEVSAKTRRNMGSGLNNLVRVLQQKRRAVSLSNAPPKAKGSWREKSKKCVIM